MNKVNGYIIMFFVIYTAIYITIIDSLKESQNQINENDRITDCIYKEN